MAGTVGKGAWIIPVAIVAALVLIFSAGGLGGLGGRADIVGSVEMGTDGTDGPVTSPPGRQPAPALTTSARSPAATVPATAAPVPKPPAAGPQRAGTVLVAGLPLLPLAQATRRSAGGGLSAYSGGRAVGRLVRVQAVDANEGFWVGTSSRNRVWVQLTGPPPESPYSIRVGDLLSFVGTVRPNGAGFARRIGVNRAEGEAMLNAQGQHLDVPKHSLSRKAR
jgi:hypothetical protein